MFFEVTDSSVTLNRLSNKGLQRRLQNFWIFLISFPTFFLYAPLYPYPFYLYIFFFFFYKKGKKEYIIYV